MALAAAVGEFAQGRAVALPRAGKVKEVGELASALGQARQVTLERDRLASELRLIFDNLREGLATFTPEGESVYWNPAALQMHGFSSEKEALVPTSELQRILRMVKGAGVADKRVASLGLGGPLPDSLRGRVLCGPADQWRGAGRPGRR